jgi:4-hydroxy-tetrahydrodipicolinate synthase
MTALVTPFRDGAIDEEAFRSHVEWQIESGTQGLVPVGTTGESPTLSHAEHERVVELCVDQAKGRVPVVAGAGSNNTAEAVALARHAEAAGADAVLVVTPYYNKPTQEGLYRHFAAVNDAVGIPIIIYNIPPRSVIDMSVATMARLYELKNIVGREGRDREPRPRLAAAPRPWGADFIQLSGRGHDRRSRTTQAGGQAASPVGLERRSRLCAEMHERACRAISPARSRSGPPGAPARRVFLEPGLRARVRPCPRARNEEIRLPDAP